MIRALLFLIFGLLVGLGYFVLLRIAISLYFQHGRRRAAMALYVAHLSAAIALFTSLTRLGAGPVLWTFLGFLGGRSLILHRARRQP